MLTVEMEEESGKRRVGRGEWEGRGVVVGRGVVSVDSGEGRGEWEEGSGSGEGSGKTEVRRQE